MHFVITFGFLIPLKSDENVENDEGTGKDKVSRKRKQWRKKTMDKDAYEIVESKQNIKNVGQVVAEIHGEYELLPGYTFKFDCRCWKTAAKVYTEHGDWSLRPISCPFTENAIWILFSVHHVVHLNETQIHRFFNHVITYQIFSGKNKLSERAKRDKLKGFYIDEKSINVGQHDFLEIYPSDLNTITKPVSEAVVITHETDGYYSITTYLDMIPDSEHQCKFWKMIRKDRFPSESLKLELHTISTEIEQKSKSKKRNKSVQKKRLQTKKSKTRKQKNEATHAMSLPAETLFSDMGAITRYTGMSRIPNVSSILIYAQCVDILSNKQLRMELNPISIKLEQMSKFPDNLVIGSSFNYLYAKILFVDRAIVTPYYVPARTIYFEFVKCFLSDEFRAENLISFLGTQFLTVEIIGIRTVNVAKSDFNAVINVKSPRALKISDKEEVLLGVATFDVSDLIRGSWEVRLTSSLSRPRDMYCIGIDDESDKGLEKVAVSRTDSPLTSEILTSFGTYIKIKVRAAYDLRPVHRNVLRHVITLNRIFLILNDFKLANDILADVFSHNFNLFCTLQISNEDNGLQIEDTYKNILTGFAIDCCDKFFIFLEGLSKGYLLQIWEKVAKLPTEDGYVYYNSSSVFLTRLYEDFVPLGGVLKIKLSESLEAQLQKHGLYVGETGTMLRSKATRTMGMMTLALTMKSLSQECLFPRPNYIKAFMDEIRENYFGSSRSNASSNRVQKHEHFYI